MKKEDIKIGGRYKWEHALPGDYLTVTSIKEEVIYYRCDDGYEGLSSNTHDWEELSTTEQEVVVNNINPAHYQAGGVQVIDQMIELYGVEKVKAFCEVNAYKYFSRAGKKAGNSVEQDLAKAAWYINKLKELSDEN